MGNWSWESPLGDCEGNRGVNHGGKEEEWKETHIQELLKKKGLRKKGEEERTQGLSA